jgi:hypothetical protein
MQAPLHPMGEGVFAFNPLDDYDEESELAPSEEQV